MGFVWPREDLWSLECFGKLNFGGFVKRIYNVPIKFYDYSAKSWLKEAILC